MVRPEIRYLVDIFMLIIFIVCAVTGFILWSFFPSFSGTGLFVRFLGADKRFWITIHDYSSAILVVVIVIHFVINFNWIIQITKKILGRAQT